MKQTLTTEEMIEYITMNKRTPDTVRRVAQINAMLAEDDSLRCRMEALEQLYDAIALAPIEDRKAFLLASLNESEGLQRQG